MTYYFAKTIDAPFDEAVEKTVAALKQHGFGVLTRIDVKNTLKEKIGAEFRPYVILGACNPHMAHKALQAEDKIGTMLPCNVIVQQHGGKSEVAAVRTGRDGQSPSTASDPPSCGSNGASSDLVSSSSIAST